MTDWPSAGSCLSIEPLGRRVLRMSGHRKAVRVAKSMMIREKAERAPSAWGVDARVPRATSVFLQTLLGDAHCLARSNDHRQRKPAKMNSRASARLGSPRCARFRLTREEVLKVLSSSPRAQVFVSPTRRSLSPSSACRQPPKRNRLRPRGPVRCAALSCASRAWKC